MAESVTSPGSQRRGKFLLFCTLACLIGIAVGSLATYFYWNTRYVELFAQQLGSRATSVRMVGEGDCSSIVGRFFEDTPRVVQYLARHLRPGPLRDATLRQVEAAYAAHDRAIPPEIRDALRIEAKN
jgi:hypothetical protein